jgi:hypothetical protein
MGFLGHVNASIATRHVHSLRNWLKVVGIDATSHPAKMIQYLPIRNRSVLFHKLGAMDKLGFFLMTFTANVLRNHGVAVFVESVHPQPAPGHGFRDKLMIVLVKP